MPVMFTYALGCTAPASSIHLRSSAVISCLLVSENSPSRTVRSLKSSFSDTAVTMNRSSCHWPSISQVTPSNITEHMPIRVKSASG